MYITLISHPKVMADVLQNTFHTFYNISFIIIWRYSVGECVPSRSSWSCCARRGTSRGPAAGLKTSSYSLTQELKNLDKMFRNNLVVSNFLSYSKQGYLKNPPSSYPLCGFRYHDYYLAGTANSGSDKAHLRTVKSLMGRHGSHSNCSTTGLVDNE